MKIDNLEFVDFPRQVSIEEYDRSEKQFADYFCNHPAVAAIYKLGSVGDPGISDLDLILVLKEGGVLTPGDYEFLNGVDDYIFIHHPFVISETLFPYVNYLFFASNLHNLAGEIYSFAQFGSGAENAQITWLICAEASLSRLCDIVYQATRRRGISARRMLLKLNSIKHDIDLLEDVSDTAMNTRLRGFARQISELRKSWFSLDEKEQVREILRTLCEAIAVLSQIMDSLACLSREVFGLPSEDRVSAYTLFPDSLQVLKFESRAKTSVRAIANPLSFLRRSCGKYGPKITRHTNDISAVTLPVELLFSLLPVPPELSRTAGNIRDNITIRGEDRVSQWSRGNHSDLLLRRYRLVDMYNDFVAGNNASSMSLLLMAPWLTTRKAKFHDTKRVILKIALKLQLI
ncbi:MAG: hypothetical protein ABIF19_20070 [Planctomycetota bacterium]